MGKYKKIKVTCEVEEQRLVFKVFRQSDGRQVNELSTWADNYHSPVFRRNLGDIVMGAVGVTSDNGDQ